MDEILRRIPPPRREASAAQSLVGGRADAFYYRLLERLGHHDLSADFVFLRASQAIEANAKSAFPRCELGVRYWLFAKTGTGDGWLLRLDAPSQSEVAFVDHDEESRARPRPLPLDLRGWLQLADLFRQVEEQTERNPALLDRDYRLRRPHRAAVKAAIERLAPGLGTKYPLAL
ncbi:MAG: hypothetical protein IT379_40270 [Deltaproteobacteria bacterium]|nr:hypothetical protein [Deltaproteobacteria bacterium]